MNAFRVASKGQLAGVLRVSDEKLVSSDYLSSTESSIIDADATVMLDDRTAKIVAWYDNEYGFASRSESLAVSLVKADPKCVTLWFSCVRFGSKTLPNNRRTLCARLGLELLDGFFAGMLDGNVLRICPSRSVLHEYVVRSLESSLASTKQSR